ncbi:PIN domain-containing protein [Mesorhizobium sp.]|uniref:PIN domain-containing protein n=1 Tax=Mesorhizobium sp. TaxID=1871066 RepID=UPI0025DDF375|nr:PIN domain-containing protein [Mesorhizobium sp.]
MDACVLYPAPLRDLLVELAAGGGLYRAKWTEQIHDEWIRNLLEDRPDIKPEQIYRTRDLMNRAVPDCLVDGYQDLLPSLALPDEDDRHVLAAAIVSASDAIVTFNVKDFPKPVLDKYLLDVIHPDDFIFHQFGIDNAAVLVSVQRCRARLRNPPRSAAEYLDTLERQGLPKTVGHLRAYAGVV